MQLSNGGNYEARILAYDSSNNLIGDVVKQGLDSEATKPFGFVYTRPVTSVVIDVVDDTNAQTGFVFGTIYFDTSKLMGLWENAPA